MKKPDPPPPEPPGVLGSVWSSVRSLFHLTEHERSSLRLDCDVPVRCESQGQTFDGRIVDISLRGMRLLIAKPVEKKSEISLTRPGEEGAVLVRVVWVRKVTAPVRVEVGVLYAEEELPAGAWVYDVFRTLNEGSGRKHVRLGVDAPGTAQNADHPQAAPVDCVVRNLGVGGCCFESTVDWPTETRLQVKVGPLARLRVLTVYGRVVHSTQTSNPHRWQAGVEFDTKLEKKQEELLGRYIAFLAATQ